jgi:hypothetical protein
VMGPSKKIQKAVTNAKEWMQKNQPDSYWSWVVTSPLSTKYRPKLDISPELEAEESFYLQLIIGMMWWIVELRQMDITGEVSMLSSHLVLPRYGHLQQAFHICVITHKWSLTQVIHRLMRMDPSIWWRQGGHSQ